MFKKKEIKEETNIDKLAKKYKRILDNAETLPPNSKEMYKIIRKSK